MKDQNTIKDTESYEEKYNRALDLLSESLHKPDHVLRACAHNQKCFNELMTVKHEVLSLLPTLRKQIRD